MTISTERFKKVFTLSEAQKALPLVRSIVTDLVESWGALNEAHAAEEARAGQKGRREETRASDALQDRYDECAHELNELGIELRDPGLGLVDFPWKRGEQVVYLCWKLGETSIGAWHELESGYSARQPL